jgi:hypothetical protein
VQGSSPDELPSPAETVANLATAMGIEGADHGYAPAREIGAAILIDR